MRIVACRLWRHSSGKRQGRGSGTHGRAESCLARVARRSKMSTLRSQHPLSLCAAHRRDVGALDLASARSRATGRGARTRHAAPHQPSPAPHLHSAAARFFRHVIPQFAPCSKRSVVAIAMASCAFAHTHPACRTLPPSGASRHLGWAVRALVPCLASRNSASNNQPIQPLHRTRLDSAQDRAVAAGRQGTPTDLRRHTPLAHCHCHPTRCHPTRCRSAGRDAQPAAAAAVSERASSTRAHST